MNATFFTTPRAVRSPFSDAMNVDSPARDISQLTSPTSPHWRGQYSWTSSPYSNSNPAIGVSPLEHQLVGPAVDMEYRAPTFAERQWDTASFGALGLDLGTACPPSLKHSSLGLDIERLEPLHKPKANYGMHASTPLTGPGYDRTACRPIELPALEEGSSRRRDSINPDVASGVSELSPPRRSKLVYERR